jgi:hypothetical protein
MPRTVDYSDKVEEAIVDHRYSAGSGAPLSDDQVKRVLSLREHSRLLARHVLQHVPPSWERDEALKAVDECMSWSARAITRHEGPN